MARDRVLPPPISISPPPPFLSPTSDNNTSNPNTSPFISNNPSLKDDLYIDDNIDSYDRWLQYIQSSHNYSKLLHIHDVHEIIKQYGFTQNIRDKILLLLNDADNKVKECMINTIASLDIPSNITIDYNTKNKHLQFDSNNRYIYHITTLYPYLSDTHDSMRDAACNSLIALCQLMNEVERQDLLRCVLTLAHSESDEQRVTSIKLLHSLSLYLHCDLVNNFICSELGVMSDDNAFRVRKATGQCFGNIARVVGPDVTINKLLSHYIKLCTDLIWGVRRGCIDSIIELTSILPLEYKIKYMVPQMESFLRDTSRWVRSGSASVLGHFIYCIGRDAVTATLIKHYCDIPTLTSVDPEVTYYCAYNLPAVLLTLGCDYWHDIRPCFDKLLQDNKYTVRNTVSYALHEIVGILGSEITIRDILPAINILLHDISEVKIGIITNIYKILYILPHNERLQFIPILHQLATQTENWRIRLLLAEQLSQLFGLYGITLHTLLWILLRDDYSAVRIQATHAVKILIQLVLNPANAIIESNNNTSIDDKQISDHYTDHANTVNDCSSTTPAATDDDTIMTPSIMSVEIPTHDDIMNELTSFATSSTYHDRQLFIHIAFNTLPVENDYFVSHINKLVSDDINNVRVTLAQQLIQYININNNSLSDKNIQQFITTLDEDSNKDVQYIIRSVQLATTIIQTQTIEPTNNTDISTCSTIDTSSLSSNFPLAQSPMKQNKPDVPARPRRPSSLLGPLSADATNQLNMHTNSHTIDKQQQQSLVT